MIDKNRLCISDRRNLSVRDARAMLTATLRWRDEFNVDAAVKEVFPQEVFGQVGHIYGRDKGGRPIVYVSVSVARTES